MADYNQDGKRCPITGLSDCRKRDCELHYMDAPIQFAPEYAERVQTIVSSTIVSSDQLWDCDRTSPFAILMDGDDGQLHWHRSRDWILYGTQNGWTRVARVLEVQ